MKSINRLLTNICSEELAASKNFYTQLFDFEVAFDSDWFINLKARDKQLELGIIDRKHKLVPAEYRNAPAGFYLTFVTDNADKLFEIAKSEGFEVVEEPHNTFYGQRRLLLKDPDGTLVDISSPITDFE